MMKQFNNLAYLSGKFVPFEDILAPLSLFAYGSYTTIKYSPEGLLFLSKHLKRLKYNCNELNIPYPGDKSIVEGIKKTLDKNNYRNKDVIIRVTLFPETISWANPHEIKNTPCSILVSTREMYFLPKNYKLLTVNLSRHLPHLKTISYTVNFLGRAKAREAGYHDGLFYNENGHISEGTAWNIFFIKNSKVCTPPPESGILEGITRESILEICNKLNIEVCTENISLGTLNYYDAAFITNSSQGPHGVMQIDNISYDLNNRILKMLKEEYLNLPKEKLEY